MPVSRRFVRAGVAMLAVSAGAFAVALVANPQLLRQGLAGQPDARGPNADPAHVSSTPAGTSTANLASPPLPIAGIDAPGTASRGGAQAAPSASGGGAVAAASMEGFTPGPGLPFDTAAHDDAAADAELPGGEESGAQGLRTQARGLTFAAVSTHRFGGGAAADDIDLPDEPTSAGVAAIAAGAAGGAGWQSGGIGGVFGDAAVGSFAFATGITTAAAAEGRTMQVPARSSAVSLGPVVLASAVPEPGSVAMLLAGLFVLGAVAQRHKRQGLGDVLQHLRGR